MNGFIYALRCESFIKIGWSRNPKLRLRTAQIMNPFPVRLVGYFEALDIEERQHHLRFSEYRVGSTEWFREEGPVAEWVGTLTMAENDVLTKWLKANRGAQTRLAKFLDLNTAAISQWSRTPIERAQDVSWFTGIAVEELRPDIFKAKSPKRKRAERQTETVE